MITTSQVLGHLIKVLIKEKAIRVSVNGQFFDVSLIARLDIGFIDKNLIEVK